MIEYLTLEDVLSLVEDLGVGPVRDIGLLDSAVHRPRVSVFGRDAYPGLDDKAAVLLESLVGNHGCILRWVRAGVPLWGEPVFR